VLHPSDSDHRLAYSLAATFLGRMCLSGDIIGLSPAQWQMVERSMHLYRQAAPVIKYGTSRGFGEHGESWRHPRGWQAVRRVGVDGNQMLVVLHSFENAHAQVEVPLPPGNWRVSGSFPDGESISQGSSLFWRPPGDFTASVALLSRG